MRSAAVILNGDPMEAISQVRNEAGLLARFAAGDLDAFETIFREHQAEVFGWILRIVRQRALAEDATIETFWRIYRARAHFDATRGFGGLGAPDRDQRRR